MRRPNLDLSIVVLKRQEETVELVDLKDFIQDRQISLEVNLDPGSYIILPRTTGCTLKAPTVKIDEQIKLLVLVN